MNRLKELCEEFDLSIYDFKELGYSKNIITNIQNNRSSIDAEKLIKLCDFFQVTTDYFLCLTNDGLYVDALGKKYCLSKEKFLLYKSLNKIIYVDGKRTLDIKSLEEIKLVNGKVSYIELVNEF